MEFDEIVVKESPGLCRCCLSEGCYKDMGTEYTWMNENEVYADMLLECFDIGISQHNEGPNGPNRLICEVCITRLRDACNFKKQVLDSEKKFVDMVGRGEFRHKVLIYQSQMKAEAEDTEAADNPDIEYLEDIDYGDDDEPLKTEASCSDIAVEALVPPRRGRPRKTLKAEKKKTKHEERPKASKALAKDDILPDILTRKAWRSNNFQILFDHTSVIPFRWKNCFMCFYCGKHTNEWSDIREHTEAHGVLGAAKIAQAISKLRSKEKVVKIDISYLKCKLCNVHFLALDDLTHHLIEEHKLKYNKEDFMLMRKYNLSKSKCPECSESFVYSSFLIKHVDETHELNCYSCDLCYSSFNSLEYLETHIKTEHCNQEIVNLLNVVVNMSNATPLNCFRFDTGFRCYSCSDIFKIIGELRTHHTTEHSKFSAQLVSYRIGLTLDIAELACRECSESVDDIKSLIDHLKSKHDISISNDVLKVIKQVNIDDSFSCRICNISFDSYGLLSQHINKQHVTDNDLLCSNCGLGFASGAILTKHMTQCNNKNKNDASIEDTDVVDDAQKIYEKWLERRGIDVAAKKKKLEENKERQQEKPNGNVKRRRCAILRKHENGPAKALNASKVRRTNLQIIFNNTTLIPFKWRGKYLCFYCGNDFNDCKELRQHTVEHGDCTDKDRAIKLVKSGDVEVKLDVSDMTCKLCNKNFFVFDDIITHLSTEHMLPYNKDVPLFLTTYRLVDLKCVFCDRSYNFFHKLVTHVNQSHPVNHLRCIICNQNFNKKNDLDTHTRSRHRLEYFCKKCPQTFDSSAAMHKHKANSHGSHCNICFEAFATDNSRVNHIKKVHFDNDNILQCGFCFQMLTTKIAFLNHAAKCNVKDVADDIKPNTDDKKPTVVQIRNNITCILNMSTAIPFKFYMNNFRCFYCVKDFSECEDLKEHTRTEHPVCDVKLKCLQLKNRKSGIRIKVDVSTLACKVCFEPMQDLEQLINHLILEHKASYNKSVDHYFEPFKLIKDSFPCPYCAEIYRYFCTLLKHISESHSENRAICPFCGVTFRTESNLRFHISLRHNTMSYKCGVCDSSFPTKRHLREHSGSAHGSKVAKCSECSEKFKSPYAVQRHKIDAHGIGHKCSYCGRLFTKKSFMVDHVRRSHLKEKNVECPVCFQRFFNKYMVTRHMIMHVGERNFHCDICGKKFLWKKNLIGHMSTHLKNPTQT